jgi:hypothetical protein
MKYKILITSIIVLSVTIPALTGYSVVQFINDSNTYATINMVLGIIYVYSIFDIINNVLERN